jgi:hypothetical protein
MNNIILEINSAYNNNEAEENKLQYSDYPGTVPADCRSSGIPGRDDPKINILQLVYQWLCDARNGRWLMVLDNADDDGIFFSSNTSDERGPLVGPGSPGRPWINADHTTKWTCGTESGGARRSCD